MNKSFKKLGLAACIASATMIMAGCNSRSDDSPLLPPPGEGDIELQEDQVAIYYKRTDSEYSNWGLYLWDGDWPVMTWLKEA